MDSKRGNLRRHKIQPACRLDRFLINLGHDRTNSVIWLFFILIRTLTQNSPNSKLFYSKLNFQNSKMTRTKRTLGRNWTRYHNWYGMNNVLEAACAGQLHWNRETIHRYTLSHAPEVNQQSAQRNASNPPPLPSNDNDTWFRHHRKLPGSGKAPRKLLQVQPKKAKKKGKKVQGGVKQ